jgi:hypothetical protein
MATDKLILDIRFFECDRQRAVGALTSSRIGVIYRLPSSIHMIGARIARKLRQYGFVTGDFDHFYVCFTPALPISEKRWYPQTVFPRVRDVDYGLNPDQVNALADGSKEQAVAIATFDALELVCQHFPANRPLIQQVRQDLARHGDKMEIVHKVKETTKFSITVSYKIQPHGMGLGVVTYVDKATGDTHRKEFIELQSYEDLFSLVGSISLTGGVVRLTSRSSFQASLTTRHYNTPIEIAIANLGPA